MKIQLKVAVNSKVVIIYSEEITLSNKKENFRLIYKRSCTMKNMLCLKLASPLNPNLP